MLRLFAGVVCCVLTVALRTQDVIEPLGSFDYYEVAHFGGETHKQDLFMRGTHFHPHFKTLTFNAHGQNFTYVLQQNDKLMAGDYAEHTYSYSQGKLVGVTSQQRGVESNCHYIGKAVDEYGRVDHSTKAAVSNCGMGWAGQIQHSDGVHYSFENAPKFLKRETLDHHRRRILTQEKTLARKVRAGAQELDLHLVYKLDDVVDQGGHCGVKGPEEDHYKIQLQSERAKQKFNELVGHRHHETLAEQERYVELLIANDAQRYADFASRTIAGCSDSRCKVEDDTLTLINLIAGFYAPAENGFLYKTNVVLVAQINFDNEDPWKLPNPPAPGDGELHEVSVDDLLAKWHLWRSTPSQEYTSSDNALGTILLAHHDVGHLLSGHDFEGGVLGYAGVGALCSHEISGGINMANYSANNLPKISATIAHELGHNFGMLHDGGSNNECAETGYIMNAILSASPPTLFSSCSREYYSSSIASRGCLTDVPLTRYGTAVCGDGMVQQGEDCDCGVLDCSEADPCCGGNATQSATVGVCRLKIGTAACSQREKCCEVTEEGNCVVTSVYSESVCRPNFLNPDCDVEEMCDGTSASCPPDIFTGAGASCYDRSNTIDGVCYSGNCMSLRRQCRTLMDQQPKQYSECDTQEKLGRNSEDNLCPELYCQGENEASCIIMPDTSKPPVDSKYPNQEVATGVPCGQGKVCISGECKPAKDLNPYYILETSPWTSCSQCGQMQSRELECSQFTPQKRIRIVTGACTLVDAPPLTRQCRNESLDCVYTDDNQLEGLARKLADKYGATDVAEWIRAITPRIYGNTEFDLNDDEYLKGIAILCLLPGAICLICLVYASCFCCFDKGCGDLEEKAHPHEGCKKLLFWLILFVFSLICASMCIVVVFFNGELGRTIMDPEGGILPLMKELVNDIAIQENKFATSLNALATNNDTVVEALDQIAEMEIFLGTGESTEDGDQNFREKLNFLANHLKVMKQELPLSTYAGCSDMCTYADADYLTITGGLRANMTAYKTLVIEGNSFTKIYLEQLLEDMEKEQAYVEPAEGEKAETEAPETGSMPQIKIALENTHSALLNAQAAVDGFNELFELVESVRLPFVFVFGVLPIVSFGCVVFAGLFQVQFLYKVVYMVSWVSLVAAWAFVAIHLPLSTTFGDVCTYMDAAEDDLGKAVGLDYQQSGVLVACLANQSILQALNLTSELAFMTSSFDELVRPENNPNLTIAFGRPNLAATYEKLDSYAAPDDLGDLGYNENGRVTALGNFKTQCAVDHPSCDCSIFSLDSNSTDPVTGTYFTLYDTSASSPCFSPNVQATKDKWAEVNARSNAFSIVNTKKATLRDREEGVRDALADYKTAFEGKLSDREEIYAKLKFDMIDVANNLDKNAYCGEIGMNYRLMKGTFCGEVTNAVSLIMFSCLLLGVLTGPIVFFAIREYTYIHSNQPEPFKLGKGSKKKVAPK